MTEPSSDRHGTSPPWPPSDPAIQKVFEGMLEDGSWGRYHGPHCAHLRQKLADLHQSEFVTLCSSGTSAVELALRAAGVSDGDEVIMAAYDYKANFANVVLLGATPVLTDVKQGFPVPDPQQIREALTDRTRAIICSHLHGCFAPVSEIRELAAQHDVPVVEDVCQSPGAIHDGVLAGTAGDISVFSFGGSKLLTAGRGGAVVTRSETFHQRIRLYTQRGNDAYPLSEMQAAVLCPQLDQLKRCHETRRERVRQIVEGLGDCKEFSPVLNHAEEDLPAFYKLAILLDHDFREEFCSRCQRAGAAVFEGFPGLHLIHAKRRFRALGDLPHATALHNNLVMLHHPVLLQDAHVIQPLVTAIKLAAERI